jgi:hypothetical protein
LDHPVLGADAKRLWGELNARKEKQQDAKQALSDIRGYMKTDPRLAREQAIEWKRKGTFHTSDFVDLEQQAQRELENQLTRELDQLLGRDLYSKEVRNKIIALMTELKQIISEKEPEYRKKTELPCAVAEAEDLGKKAKAHKLGWEGVVRAWQSAYDLAVDYRDDRAESFLKHRMEAYKEMVRAQAMSTDVAKQIDLYSQLNSEVNEGDAQVWLWLGQAHLEAARQGMLREPIQSASQESTDE